MNKELKDELKEELINKLDKEKAVLIISESEGGKILIDSLKSDIETIISRLIREYETVSHITLISLISSLSAKKKLLDRLLIASSNVKTLKEEIL